MLWEYKITVQLKVMFVIASINEKATEYYSNNGFDENIFLEVLHPI